MFKIKYVLYILAVFIKQYPVKQHKSNKINHLKSSNCKEKKID